MTLVTGHDWIKMVFGAQQVVAGFDCTGANEPFMPDNVQLAGYDTGTPGIRWTNKQLNAHPGTIRIDQDFGSKPSSDVLDVERGAATIADVPVWAKQAQADFTSAARPGQRHPATYESASNVTPVVDALIAGGIKSGVGLYVANWNLTESQAIAEVLAAAGPFPIIGVQYSNGADRDYDVWADEWLKAVSGAQLAINPVRDLEVVPGTGRGYTHLDVTWQEDPNASFYSVHVYWPATGGDEVGSYDVAMPPFRVRNLLPMHTYEIRVRVHPAASLGIDASVHGTTR